MGSYPAMLCTPLVSYARSQEAPHPSICMAYAETCDYLCPVKTFKHNQRMQQQIFSSHSNIRKHTNNNNNTMSRENSLQMLIYTLSLIHTRADNNPQQALLSQQKLINTPFYFWEMLLYVHNVFNTLLNKLFFFLLLLWIKQTFRSTRSAKISGYFFLYLTVLLLAYNSYNFIHWT